MLDLASQTFAGAGIGPSAVVRIDVPGRGQSEAGEAPVRPEVEPVVPAIQSGSLFGERTGVMVVDAHELRSSEAKVVADVLAQPGAANRQVVLISSGRMKSPLPTLVKSRGEVVTVKKLRERDATVWLRDAARTRGLRLRADAVNALVERFGSDVGSLARALDQLVAVDGPITGAMILDRYRNRPDEPIWHFTDALAGGKVDTALRRLHDLLTHSHPLLVLGAIENDLRRRALAAAAPDMATFASWMGVKPTTRRVPYPVRKSWQAGNKMAADNLTRAVDAVRRADATLKTMPEETHMVTMERLTVSLCFWYRG